MTVITEIYMTLPDFLKSFTTDEEPFSLLQAVDLMLYIAEAVKVYHMHHVVDGGFKSDDILVQVVGPDLHRNAGTEETTCPIVKMAGFGRWRVRNNDSIPDNQMAGLGTTRWSAPETPNFKRFDQLPSRRFHPSKLDVYSFAIICSEILSGKEPFAGHPSEKIVFRVRVGLRPFLPALIPGRLASLIHDCWSADPLLRPEFDAICTELRAIKELLLQGQKFEKEDLSVGFNLKSVKVQGPWGSSDSDGRMFIDGVFTFLKRILLHFDEKPTAIWYMELEYDVNGTSFITKHGHKGRGDIHETINIDGPSEYLAQIEGSFGLAKVLGNLQVLQTFTFHTSKKTYGPFGKRESGVVETKFKSAYGRIVGLFGKEQESWLEQIGCFIVPDTIASHLYM